MLERNSVQHRPSCQVYRLLSFIHQLERSLDNYDDDDDDDDDDDEFWSPMFPDCLVHITSPCICPETPIPLILAARLGGISAIQLSTADIILLTSCSLASVPASLRTDALVSQDQLPMTDSSEDLIATIFTVVVPRSMPSEMSLAIFHRLSLSTIHTHVHKITAIC